MSVEHFHALTKGARLNQYEMIGILGAGGFGITYIARDTTLDTMVAIKEYLPADFAVRQGDSQVTAKSSTSKGDFDWGLKRFLDEARVLAKFRHPNIVRVNQIFEANSTAYLVMEYEKGESLDELLKRAGSLNEQETKAILFPILDGLKRVHELGFLHRDIKPANIIIREDGGAVLIDFGAARQAIDHRTRAITSIVTEGYAPLEQYDPSGNQGAWTDIYALAGVAYKCLTGNKPPVATSRVRNDPLVPLAVAAPGHVSREFASAIEAGLSVYENFRPQNIAEFIGIISGTTVARDALPSAIDATRVVSANVAPPPAAPMPSPPVAQREKAIAPATASVATSAPPAERTRTPIYFGLAAALLVVIAAGGWFYLQDTNVARQASATPAESNVTPAQSESNVAPAQSIASTPPAAPAGPAFAGASNASNAASVAAPPSPASAPIEARPEPPKPRTAEVEPIPAPAPAFHPSFDCTKARSDAERLVCSDSQLSGLDVEMAQLYQKGLGSVADTNAFNGEQLDWLARRDVCVSKQCLVVSYADRIKELERWVAR